MVLVRDINVLTVVMIFRELMVGVLEDRVEKAEETRDRLEEERGVGVRGGGVWIWSVSFIISAWARLLLIGVVASRKRNTFVPESVRPGEKIALFTFLLVINVVAVCLVVAAREM